jgi:hypothetical protein
MKNPVLYSKKRKLRPQGAEARIFLLAYLPQQHEINSIFNIPDKLPLYFSPATPSSVWGYTPANNACEMTHEIYRRGKACS